MRLNREKILTFLALVVLVFGLSRIGAGLFAPTRGIRVVPYSIPRSGREVLPRKFRTFVAEGEPGRNPFSFSEGWARLETTPLDLPPVPDAPLPLPVLASGPDPRSAGLGFRRAPDPSEFEKESGEEGER